MNNIELRNFTVNASEGLKVTGSIPTNSLSEVLTSNNKKFREKIAPGAFRKAISKAKAIDFLAEHNKDKVLSSTSNSSLELREDLKGLFVSAEIVPTTFGSDYYELIKSGILKDLSFGFRCLKDSWERRGSELIRTIHEMEIFEVSVVRSPAYSSTALAARGINLIEDVDIPEIPEKTKKSSKEERGNKNMMETLIPEMRAEVADLNELLRGETRSLTTTADGGAVIPENVAEGIVVAVEENSPLFAKAKKFNSVSGTLKIPVENATLTGAFVGEGLDLQEGNLAFEFVELKQRRVGAVLRLTNQLVNDSAVDLNSYATDVLGRKLAAAIEKSMLVGTGDAGNEFQGIIPNAAVPSVDVTGAVTILDLADMVTSLKQAYLNNACFIMERATFKQIAKLQDQNGHFYVQNGVVNGKITYTLFGTEIFISDNMPATTPVLFGNFEQGVAVMVKQGIQLKHINSDTTQALAGTQMDIVDFYADAAVYNPEAMIKLNVA